MGEVSIETMADSPSMAILTAAKDSEPASAVLPVASGSSTLYFHAGDFDRIGRGEADIQYVSKDGCRFLGLWPFRGQPAVVCKSKEECGLEAGRTVP